MIKKKEIQRIDKRKVFLLVNRKTKNHEKITRFKYHENQKLKTGKIKQFLHNVFAMKTASESVATTKMNSQSG